MISDVLIPRPARPPEPFLGVDQIVAGGLADLSLRQLLSFRAVANVGSFHGAAAELEYTQSAVSQHVAALEAALGVRLVERSRGRRVIALTDAGVLLLRHVDAIADRIQAADADLRAYAAGALGTLRIGTYQSAATKVLPAAILTFAQAWPDVEIRLTESSSDSRLLELVEQGELDLAFGVLPIRDGPFEWVELLLDPFVLVVPAGSPLASLTSTPSPLEIAMLPLIGSRTCRSTAAAETHLRRAGGEPRFVFRSEDNSTVQAMVGSGLGVALTPRLAVDASDPSIVIIPTDLPARHIALIWHRDRYRAPAARAFVDSALGVCAGMQAEVEPGVAR